MKIQYGTSIIGILPMTAFPSWEHLIAELPDNSEVIKRNENTTEFIIKVTDAGASKTSDNELFDYMLCEFEDLMRLSLHRQCEFKLIIYMGGGNSDVFKFDPQLLTMLAAMRCYVSVNVLDGCDGDSRPK